MRYPKRYSPFYTLRNGDTGLASFGVEPRDDGIYVEHSECWKLFEKVISLQAEVDKLRKGDERDMTAAYLYAAEQSKDVIARLKAEIARLKSDNLNQPD